MRTRKRASVLRDKTPGNTPQKEKRAGSKDLLSTAKKPFAARTIHGRRVGTDEVLPRNFLTSQTSILDSPTPAQPPAPAPGTSTPLQIPVESTPITRRHHRARLSTVALKSSMKVPFSPLPPSSPPSSDDDDIIPAIPSLQSRVEIKEHAEVEPLEDDEDENENKENEDNRVRQRTEVTVEESVDEDAPEDDPFGFLAVERELKVRREMRNRGSVPPLASKGKEVVRAPFKELSFDPSAASPSASRMSQRRPPTPYHPSDDLRESDGLRAPPSDDLEDMYLDPTPQAHQVDSPVAVTSANRSVGRIELRREMEDEEDAEVEPEETSENVHHKPPPQTQPNTELQTHSPPHTPRPHHIANIVPLESPFSSTEGTSSKEHTLPSSPSPVKRPSAVVPPVQTTVKKSTWADRFKAVTASAPPVKARPRVTKAKENASEDIVMSTSILLDRLPKRPIKRPTATRVPTSARKAASQRKGKGKQRAEVVASEAEVSDEAEESPDETPLAARARKRRAAAKARYPAKKARVEVVVPTRRSLRNKPTISASAVARAKGKGKAAAASVVARLEGEDSDEARTRQARIEYYHKLDDYQLAKENVYVV